MIGQRVGQTCLDILATPSFTAHSIHLPKGRLSVRRRTVAPDKSVFFSIRDNDSAGRIFLSPQFEVGISQDRVVAIGATPNSIVKATHEEPLASTPDSNAKVDNSKCDEYHPSKGWKVQAHHPSKEKLWATIRMEAVKDAASEPVLASFLYSTIMSHTSFEKTLAFLLANKLSNSTVLGAVQLMGLFQMVFENDPTIIEAALADLLSVKDRDPACEKYTQCLLYFKGYQAIQCHRVAHWLWNQGRKSLALALQSRLSEVFHVDIHPGAIIGRGVLLDHATGVVIGETAVVGDNVSMLHHVTLGGSGTGKGKRHPTIEPGVLLGAGVSVLGPIVIGSGSKVGAGSVVVSDLPAHSVAVGVPAKVIKRDVVKEPVHDMDQCYDFIIDYII